MIRSLDAGAELQAKSNSKGRLTESAPVVPLLKLFEKACELGDMLGCVDHGQSLLVGRGTTRDAERARALFVKACTSNNSSGCMLLGRAYRDGDGGERDLERARALFERACGERNAEGCSGLGQLYVKALGVKEDIALGNAHYEKACELGDVCNGLAFSYALGRGVKKDVEKANELFARASMAMTMSGASGGVVVICATTHRAASRVSTRGERPRHHSKTSPLATPETGATSTSAMIALGKSDGSTSSTLRATPTAPADSRAMAAREHRAAGWCSRAWVALRSTENRRCHDKNETACTRHTLDTSNSEDGDKLSNRTPPALGACLLVQYSGHI